MPAPIVRDGITVHRIIESEAPLFSIAEFFPDLTQEMQDENRSWTEPRFFDPATKAVILCIQSYLVKLQGQTILIDTCAGNHKHRPTRPFWHQQTHDRYARGLAATGHTVDDIDMVMCTHLHGDHTGWNTRLDNGRWVPTFPKAKYVFADREMAFWADRHKKHPEACPWIKDSVLPIVKAGRHQLVKSDHALSDNMRLLPTPGHTIDHFSVHCGKPGHDFVVTGDMIHSPIQARYPELGMMSDYDSKLGGVTRRQFFNRFADSSTLMCTAHFPSPSAGRFTKWGDGFKWSEV
jgi:glyoxylase-like metal-dependent hydrolase (beta-lactamase superfamily II)